MTDLDEKEGLELQIPEALRRPSFVNFTHSNTATLNDQTMITLTFVHIFTLPTEGGESRGLGEVVARILMTPEKAIALRNLLIRQFPITVKELEKQRRQRRQQKARS